MRSTLRGRSGKLDLSSFSLEDAGIMAVFFRGVENSHRLCILKIHAQILFGYKLDPTTWAYISALMMIGIYFKFRRFWSVRNLDLVGLICFSPGLLLIYHGLPMQHAADPIVAARGAELVQGGYVWLFAVSGFFLIRLLLDPVMVRRPLLEPNLSASGLTFTGIALLVFLMANVITSPKERLEYELAKQETQSLPSPGYEWFYKFAGFANEAVVSEPDVAKPRNPRGPDPGGDDSHGSHPGPFGHRGRHGLARLPAFRQHPHRRGGRHSLPAELLHQPNDQLRRPRRARCAVGLGGGGVSAAAAFRRAARAWPPG